MKKLLGIVALSFSLLASQAHADIAKMYVGLGVSDGQIELMNSSEDDKSLSTIHATLGFQLLDFVGIELELGTASDQTGSILSEPQVQYQAALVRLGYRFDRTGVYLLGGQARLDIDSGLNPADAGLAIGGGINLFGNETTALNLHYLSIDGGTFTAASIGFQYYFGGFR